MGFDPNLPLPRHIAFIMDGNGRWANERGQKRVAGHRAGGKVFRAIGNACLDRDIEVITFFAFSTENWKRPKAEISALMKLFDAYLHDWFSEKRAFDTQLSFLGDLSFFSENERDLINRAEHTGNDIRHYLNIALNYGGRADILSAANAVLQKRIAAHDDSPITEREISDHLATAGMPDVDLLIRTGAEKRISNFLLWQSAYAEIYFTDTLWPDFTEEDLDQAISWFQHRERRYGAIRAKGEQNP